MLTPDRSDDVVQKPCGKNARLRGEESEAQTEKKMVDRRRWEDLDADCLANVFRRVEIESLLLGVPFVCKSWYAVTINPVCWQCLDFPSFKPYPLFTDKVEDQIEPPRSFGPFYDKFVEQYRIDRNRFSITAFVKFVVDRSRGNALLLKLPEFCTEEALRYVSDKCPLLEALWLTDDLVLFKLSQIVPEVIGKWKFLEWLSLGGSVGYIMEHMESDKPYFSKHFEGLLTLDSPLRYDVLNRVLVQIGTHCKRFEDLHIFNVSLGEVEASTIVNLLPKLKYLVATKCRIERDSVGILLRGCKELVLVDFNHCEGFDDGDKEILKLASHIDTFLCDGCVGRDQFGLDLVNNVRIVISMILDLSNMMMNDG